MAAVVVVALLWWLSAVESLLTLGSGKSVASCSFISMLTYFAHTEGHGNREKTTLVMPTQKGTGTERKHELCSHRGAWERKENNIGYAHTDGHGNRKKTLVMGSPYPQFQSVY